MKKIVFFNIAWMQKYKGLNTGDTVQGHAAFLKQKGFGAEIFNFQRYKGRFYGSLHPPKGGNINIEKLGAGPDDDYIDGITVVWVAGRPGHRGRTVVGWYKNARIYRTWAQPPEGAKRYHKGRQMWYLVTAKASDVVLLPKEERIVSIPVKKGWMGQANIWYAEAPQRKPFLKLIDEYVRTRKPPVKLVAKRTRGAGQPRQSDPEHRVQVERSAIKLATNHFTKLGYTVISREKDYCGWDLEAHWGDQVIKIEVKGLSGKDVLCELTPNEFTAFQQKDEAYRLAVVTNALGKPKLHLFSVDLESGYWRDEHECTLAVQKLTGARLSLA